MTAHVFRFRQVKPDELIPVEKVLETHHRYPFQPFTDYPEPYRSAHIAFYQLENVYYETFYNASDSQKKSAITVSPLITQTPRGEGLIWQVWGTQIAVVLINMSGKDAIDDNKVTFFTKPEELAQITFCTNKIVINPPSWVKPNWYPAQYLAQMCKK